MNHMELSLAMDILKFLKEHNAPIMKLRLLEETDKGGQVYLCRILMYGSRK